PPPSFARRLIPDVPRHSVRPGTTRPSEIPIQTAAERAPQVRRAARYRPHRRRRSHAWTVRPAGRPGAGHSRPTPFDGWAAGIGYPMYMRNTPPPGPRPHTRVSTRDRASRRGAPVTAAGFTLMETALALVI